MKFTKSEIKAINEYEGGKFNPDLLGTIKDARGKHIQYIIVVSHGRKNMHDSGYPFIKILGRGKDGEFYNLGWHDHWLAYVSTNTDSLGKNVFRVMPWIERDKPWVVHDSFWSGSTFQIGEYSFMTNYNTDRVILK